MLHLILSALPLAQISKCPSADETAVRRHYVYFDRSLNLAVTEQRVGIEMAKNPSIRLPWIMLLSMAAMVLALVAAAYLQNGKFGVEKTLTKLAMPVGLGWLILGGLAFQKMSAGWKRCLPSLAAWLLVTLLGTSTISNFCMQYLESSQRAYQPGVDADLDVLVVLGGGTRQGPYRAEAGNAGDRVLYAAQLYQQGHVKRLVTTGTAAPNRRAITTDPKEQTVEIWTKLGIPAESIDMLDGVNTYAEIQSLKLLMPSLAGQRIGLLTSAYHLPRAMRLARAQGLNDLVPVPADYHTRHQPQSLWSYQVSDIIPTAHALDRLANCQHEFMAWFVSR